VTTDSSGGGAGTGIGQQLRDLLRASFDALPISVVMADRDGAIVAVNRSLERLVAYARAELIGQSLEVVVPTALGVIGPAAAAAPADAGRDMYARRKDGAEIPVVIHVTPMVVEGRSLMIVSIVDLTERRHAETRLRHAFEERITFERLVGDLAAHFVNLRPEEVHRTIDDALARIGRELGLDRSTLFQLVEDGGDFVHTHQWTRPGCMVPPARVSALERFPWHLSKVRRGEPVIFADVDEVPEAIDRDGLRWLGTRSGVTLPLVIKGRTWGALTFAAVSEPRTWNAEIINRFQLVALMFANVLARKEHDESLRRALAGHADQHTRLRDENAYLRDEIGSFVDPPVIVANSAATRRVLDQVRHVAAGDDPVLLVGETGSGKSLMATHLHHLSARRERLLVRCHCSSSVTAATEAHLFGRRSGVYVRDEPRQAGLFEVGNGSTVFVDEIAELTLDTQARLARTLRRREIQPLGTTRPIPVDVRLVAATTRDLRAAVAAGTFREDLYSMIDAPSIGVPPLRERVEDITPLVWRFVDEFSTRYGKTIDAIDAQSLRRLHDYPWPGNARELRNVVERAVIVSDGRRLRIPIDRRQHNRPRVQGQA
jgi:formate hydrogenlyase transcriptional activator